MLNPREAQQMAPDELANYEQMLKNNHHSMILNENAWRGTAARLEVAATMIEDQTKPDHEKYMEAVHSKAEIDESLMTAYVNATMVGGVAAMLRAMAIEAMLKRVYAAEGRKPPSHHDIRKLAVESGVFTSGELKANARPQTRIPELGGYKDMHLNALLSFMEEQKVSIEAPRYPSPKPSSGYVGLWRFTDLILYDYVSKRIEIRLSELGVANPGLYYSS